MAARARAPTGVAQGVSPSRSDVPALVRAPTFVAACAMSSIPCVLDRRAAVPFPRRDLRRERLRPAPRAGAPARDPGGALRGGARIRDRRVRRRGGPRHAGHGVGLPLDGAPEHIVPRVLPRGVLAVLPRARGEREVYDEVVVAARGPPGGARVTPPPRRRASAPWTFPAWPRSRRTGTRASWARSTSARTRASGRSGTGARSSATPNGTNLGLLGRRRERPRRLRGRRQPGELVRSSRLAELDGDARASAAAVRLGRGRRR